MIFPYLSQSARLPDRGDLRTISTFGMTLMVVILLPLSVFVVTLNRPLVELLFQRGRFDVTAAYLTAGALAGYGVGLAFNGIGYVLPRIMLAIEKNHIIALLGCGNVLLKVVYNTLLIPVLGHRGIALGTSLMYATTDLLFIIVLAYYGVVLDLKAIMRSLAVGIMLGVLIFLLAVVAKSATQDAFVRVCSVAVCAAVMGYGLLRSPKLHRLVMPIPLARDA